MVLVQTKKSGRGGRWNDYSFESASNAKQFIFDALQRGYRVKINGKEVFGINKDGTLVYLPKKR